MSEHPVKPSVVPAPLPEESRRENGPERRAWLRYPFTAAAEVFDLRSQTRVTGRCSDLGPGGCYVDTLSPFAVGTVVRVRIECELREFEAAAIVTNAHVSLGMGLAFTEVKNEHQATLRTWIAELSGEQPPEPEVTSIGGEPGLLTSIANLRKALNEVINLMVRKKIITDQEGAGLLRQIFR